MMIDDCIGRCSNHARNWTKCISFFYFMDASIAMYVDNLSFKLGHPKHTYIVC